MDKREAATVVASLAAAFPSWNAGRETVAIYVDALADLPYDLAARAVRNLILTNDFPPTVATLRSAVAREAGALAPSPLIAWDQARTAMSGGSRDNFHPAVASTVAAIGWWELRHTTNLETVRAQFLRLYQDAATQYDYIILTDLGKIALDAVDGGGAGDVYALAEVVDPPA